jgi:hypothetical protein
VQSPPACSIALTRSLAYGLLTLVVTIILIAACAVSIRTTGLFSYEKGLFLLLATAVAAWALWDAGRPRHGALHYAAGEWVLAQGESETLGTLQVALDLQHYVLARFTPLASDADNALAPDLLHIAPAIAPTQWLHLDSRQARQYGQDWWALRRALFAAPAAQWV